MRHRLSIAQLLVAALSAAAIGTALLHLIGATRGLDVTHTQVGTTPVTIHRPAAEGPAPAVVIAHGFAGSRQLMAPFAISLARAGYVAISFDFQGHGRNPQPMTGDVTREDGATRALVLETREVMAFARDLAGTDGQVALLGHSMASDIIVRAAIADADVAATIAVSMFSEEVTPDRPRNLLMIVGGWEQFLSDEALRVLAESHGPGVVEGQTYGSVDTGNARRVALSDGVEHVGVLYASESLIEARNWLNGIFGRDATAPVDARGPWLGLLLLGIVALAWPLAALLPRCPPAREAPAMTRRQLLAAILVPAAITPLVLWPLPTGFLSVLVADYLALHFALYGALTAAMLWWRGLVRPALPGARLLLTAALSTLYVTFAMGLALDAFVASFWPHAGRMPVIAALAAGALAYTLADEWLIRRPDAPWWAGPLARTAMLISLGLAVALDLADLFFLIIILPVILLFFLIYGLFARWIVRATGHPTAAGIAVGIAFGWALGVTFPMIA